MNVIKDRANVCKIRTCGDRLKAESFVLARTQLLSNSLIHKSFLWFQLNSTKESYDTSRIV